MSDDPTIAPGANDNLVRLGLLNQSLGLKQVRVYLDYYRAVSNGTALGLMDGEQATYQNLNEVNAVWRNEATLLGYRLNPASSPINQVLELQPVLIRITITSPDLPRPLFFFTARKQ
jgi:hypothetical protein